MLVHLEVQDEIVMNREEADLHWELIFKKGISIHSSYRGDKETQKSVIWGTQLQQPQFQVRIVQFPQQSGPAQIQHTIVQSPRGATTPVQIHTQQAQIVQGLQQVCQQTRGLLMSNGRYIHSSVG